MSCGPSGKSKSLCPVSFGLALGLTCAIAVAVWSAWVMHYGMPADMVGHMVPPASWSAVAERAGWSLLKGFLFGFVLALLYDFIACCCKARCCNKMGACGCGKAGCDCCKPKA